MAREGLSDKDKRELFEEEVVKLGLTALRKAKKRAPVDTGRLRASISLASNSNLIQSPGPEAKQNDSVDIASDEYSVKIGTNVFYAKLLEFGSVNRPAQPFLRPAADEALRKRGYKR